MTECWLPVVGWETFYEVSDLGRNGARECRICMSKANREYRARKKAAA